MDFLNKAYAQLSELFRSMTPAGRVTTGMLFLAVVVSLVFLFRQQIDRTDEYLFEAEDLSGSEIIALEAAFSRAGLSQWEVVGNRVRVPRLRKHDYLRAAAEGNALPESLGNVWDKMLQQGSPFETRDMRELRRNATREKDIELTLRLLKDIERANVTIDESAVEGFPPRRRRRAMAAVKSIGNKRLDEDQVRTIRLTVAAGAGVDAEDVTVTDLNGSVYPGLGRGGAGESQNLHAASQRMYVNHYRQIIAEHLLPMVPGATVAVSVELDRDVESKQEVVKYDDKATSIETNIRTKEVTSTSSGTGGRPGAETNGVLKSFPAQATSASSGNQSTSKEDQDSQKNIVGATRTMTHKAGFSPVWVAATIGIPTSHFRNVWHANNLPAKGASPKDPTPDELKQIETDTVKKIEDTVKTLLPRRPKGEDIYEPVKVVTFTETPTELPAEPSVAATAFGWFAENWQTLGLFGLAGFGVIFLRGMIRSAQSTALAESSASREGQPAPLEPDIESLVDREAESKVSDAAAQTLKRKFHSSGRSLRDELADLVREDPDAAANILKLWISEAA